MGDREVLPLDRSIRINIWSCVAPPLAPPAPPSPPPISAAYADDRDAVCMTAREISTFIVSSIACRLLPLLHFIPARAATKLVCSPQHAAFASAQKLIKIHIDAKRGCMMLIKLIALFGGQPSSHRYTKYI
jgi:hypothetical protein